MAGPDWQAGRLTIFIVWDVGFGPTPPFGSDCTVLTLGGCRIPLVVISPGTSHVAIPPLHDVLAPAHDRGAARLAAARPGGDRALDEGPVRSRSGGIKHNVLDDGYAAADLTVDDVHDDYHNAAIHDDHGCRCRHDAADWLDHLTGERRDGQRHATVSLSAADNVGVVQINLLVDGVFFASVTKAPYNFQLNTRNYANGSHSLYAKVYDAGQQDRDVNRADHHPELIERGSPRHLRPGQLRPPSAAGCRRAAGRQHEGQCVEHGHHDQQEPVAGDERDVLDHPADDGAEEVGGERRGRRGRLPEALGEHEVGHEDRPEGEGTATTNRGTGESDSNASWGTSQDTASRPISSG